MWWKTGLLCGLLLALLVRSPRADVQYDGVDDLLNSALTLGSYVQADTFTILAHLVASGATFGGSNCWNGGPFLMDTNDVLAVGRGTGTGLACAQIFGNGTMLSSALSAGAHHLAARLSAGTLTLLVDGVAVASTGEIPLSDLTGFLALGGAPDGLSADRLMEVTVYNTALSTATIERMALSRLRNVPHGSPTAYWPLDDCSDGASGNTVSFKDRSGNNRHVVGTHGANGTGLTCQANGHLSRPWGIQ